MMMPSIFGESLFDDDFDDWFDFRMPQFPDVDKVLYGRHAKNIMKTDVKENGDKYEVSVDLPGF
ncbi:MAG: Hsp20/alpha crystallin family protein, partial [Lachnospiraceae bacterium]|nr:Hsp20/alpha crystallin family protein [Lachnospiraceae bacterium]